MKLSKIFILVWFLIGLGLIAIDWRWMVIWTISGFLCDLVYIQEKKEAKPKKKRLYYVD